MIPFGPFAPDMPANNGAVCLEATNVVPVPQGYGPVRGLVETGSPVPGAPLYAFGAFDPQAGQASIFAATATKIYRATEIREDYVDLAWGSGPDDLFVTHVEDIITLGLEASQTMWTDVSAGTYGASTWRGTLMGSAVIFTDYADALQIFDLRSASVFTPLGPSVPRGRHIATAANFVMLGDTQDVDGVHNQRVHWSAIEDPGTWPTPGTDEAVQVQSDYQDLLGDGGSVTGIAPALSSADAVIFEERALWRCVYVGSPAVFQFDRIAVDHGLPYPDAFVSHAGVVYYWSQRGFHLSDGTQAIPIGTTPGQEVSWVDRYFAREADSSTIRAAVDPARNRVVFSFVSQTDATRKALVYDFVLRRWSLVSGWDAALFFTFPSLGYNLDTLDDVLPGGIDAHDISVDDSSYLGGRRSLAALTPTGVIAFDSGETLEAVIATGDAQLAEGNGVYCSQIWPMTDAATVYARVSVRDNLSQAPRHSAERAMNRWSIVPVEARGRFARFRMRIPAGETWTYAQGVTPKVQVAGRWV